MPYLRAVLFVLALSCAGFPCPSVAADTAAANSQYQVPKVGDSEESVLARFGPVKGRLPLPDGKLMLSFAVGDVIIKSGFVITGFRELRLETATADAWPVLQGVNSRNPMHVMIIGKKS